MGVGAAGGARGVAVTDWRASIDPFATFSLPRSKIGIGGAHFVCYIHELARAGPIGEITCQWCVIVPASVPACTNSSTSELNRSDWTVAMPCGAPS